MKAGIRTTEFWLALIVVLLGALASVYASAEWARVAGIIAAALTSAGYGFVRAQVKVEEAVMVNITDDTIRAGEPVFLDDEPIGIALEGVDDDGTINMVIQSGAVDAAILDVLKRNRSDVDPHRYDSPEGSA